MMDPRLTLSNRPENLKPLMNYVRKWAEDRGLSPNRRCSLEKAVEDIFRHLVTYAYQPDQPGSIAISLEERGPRNCGFSKAPPPTPPFPPRFSLSPPLLF